jgi:histidinol-phosphate/aromatic aminotransferase/cobyric acid decarboxylase-like protein
MRATVARTADIRDRFAQGLQGAGYEVPESRTNFVLVRFADAAAAAAADDALRGADIIVRGLSGYGLTDCLRMTVGPQDVMDRTLRTLTAMRGRQCW